MNPSEQEKPRGFGGKVLFFIKFLEIRLRFVVILLITALVVGYWDWIQNYYERWTRPKNVAEEQARSEFEYYCGMHPFILRDRPGNCPICGMTLDKRKRGEPAKLPPGVLARVQVLPERVMQAGVETALVQYRQLMHDVRSYGIVTPDETRLGRIIARFPGRVEELLVNTVGQVVTKGEPLARIYSPKFLAATMEYLRALETQRQTEADPQATADAKRTSAQMADGLRQRLLSAGFTSEQLAEAAKAGKAPQVLTFYSPLAGTVLERKVLLGDTVDEGMTLYTVADLSTVWVQLQIFESDISAIRLGTPVEVTTVASPGVVFPGTVDFLYPTLNAENRSLLTRVVVANREGKLRPNMYVNAVIRSPVGRYGIVGSPEEPKVAPAGAVQYTCPMHPEVLSDKPGQCPKCGMNLVKKESKPEAPAAIQYTCPMHPEVISDKPGQCPKCGMDLVKKEAPPAAAASERWVEGYACAMHLDQLAPEGGICRICGCGETMSKWRIEKTISVPELAVIDTGMRQYVYIEKEAGVYEAVQVTTGPRVGLYYPLLTGLEAGQRVVARGSFLIDAEARLNPATASGLAGKEAGASPAPASGGGTSAPQGHHVH